MSRPEDPKWYETAFGPIYPLVYSHRNDESAQAEAEAMTVLLDLPPGRRRVLDLCCGNGRHAAVLSALGFSVYGTDLSEVLLELAAGREELAGRLVRADMRCLPFGNDFDAVVNLFTSFGYFSRDKENKAALVEAGRVVVKGGRILIDHINPPEAGRRIGSDTRKRDGLTISQRRWLEGKRVRKHVQVTLQDGNMIDVTEDVRLYDSGELEALLKSAGFTDINFYGTFTGEPLEENSERMIAVARRK